MKKMQLDGRVVVYALYVEVRGKKYWFCEGHIEHFRANWWNRLETTRDYALYKKQSLKKRRLDPICYDERLSYQDLKRIKMVRITKSRLISID